MNGLLCKNRFNYGFCPSKFNEHQEIRFRLLNLKSVLYPKSYMCFFYLRNCFRSLFSTCKVVVDNVPERQAVFQKRILSKIIVSETGLCIVLVTVGGLDLYPGEQKPCTILFFLIKFCVLRSCDILQLDKRQILHKKVHLNILVKKRPGSEAT